MFFRDSVVPMQPPFGLLPEVFSAIDTVLLAGNQLAVIDSGVVESHHIDGIIGFSIIGIDDRIRLYFMGDNRGESFTGSFENNLGINFAAALEQAEDWNLPAALQPKLSLR